MLKLQSFLKFNCKSLKNKEKVILGKDIETKRLNRFEICRSSVLKIVPQYGPKLKEIENNR